MLSYSGKKVIDKRMFYSYLFDIGISILLVLLIFFLNDKSPATTLPILGICIIIISLYVCYKVRYNKILLLMFSILTFVNISFSVSDLIQLGKYVADWQLPFRSQIYNVYTAKSILLFLSILNVFFNAQWSKKNEIKLNSIVVTRKENSIIAIVGTISLFLILFLGTNVTNSTGYTSNSNPIYEYFIVIFTATWYYSGGKRFANFLLLVSAILYVFQSFFYGDRSAAFLMLILYFFLYFKNRISLSKILILAISAILLSNFIAEYRNADDSNIIEILSGTFDRGLYSDTVSYAYYTSTTITALNHYDNNLPSNFLEYLKGFILGSGDNNYSNLAVYAREYSKDLFNRGGGLFPSYFYAFFGYLGVVISAMVLCIILRYFYSRNGEIIMLYQILIATFGIRWYLYNPINLYRVVLIIFTLLLLICWFFNKSTSKKRRIVFK